MQKNNKAPEMYVLSYFTIRIAIGILGISLPFILVLGSIILDGKTEIINSISSYYHLHIGNALVGILCAVALFLFAYRGYDFRDNFAGHLGGIFALGIAFLPNNTADPSSLIHILHFISAFLFFLVLIYFSVFLFTSSDQPKPYPKPKRNRNIVYYICGFTMLGCLFLIAVFMLWLKNYPCFVNIKPVFWLETFALIAFGISWITKGQAIFKDAVAK